MTETSKPAMADNLKSLFENGTFRTDDKLLLGEMRNYHRLPTPSGHIKLEARAGHDDLVVEAMLGAWAWSEGDFGRRPVGQTRIWIPGKPFGSRKKPAPKPQMDTPRPEMLSSLRSRSDICN
mgnify:CR=1 FL=1